MGHLKAWSWGDKNNFLDTCRMPHHQMGILRISIVFMSLMCLIESEARTPESHQIYLIPVNEEAMIIPMENKRSSEPFIIRDSPSRRGEFDADYLTRHFTSKRANDDNLDKRLDHEYLTRYRRSGNDADYLTRYRRSGDDYLTRYRKSGVDYLTRYRKSGDDYLNRYRKSGDDYLTRYRKSGNDYLTRYRKSGKDYLTRYRRSGHGGEDY